MNAADGGFAFPSYDNTDVSVRGMTLRDYFAAKALPALITVCGSDAREEGLGYPEHVAACAYGMADAMLKARAA